MNSIVYRDALRADLLEIVSIYNETIASRMVTADTSPVTERSREFWFENHNPHHRPLWVVDNELGQMVAWVSFQSFYGRPAYDATVEISIYISESHRGKGLGRQILQYSMRQAPQFGVKTILGFVFAHNEPSLQLFLSQGFSVWGNMPKIATMDLKEYDLLILGKRLVD